MLRAVSVIWCIPQHLFLDLSDIYTIWEAVNTNGTLQKHVRTIAHSVKIRDRMYICIFGIKLPRDRVGVQDTLLANIFNDNIFLPQNMPNSISKHYQNWWRALQNVRMGTALHCLQLCVYNCTLP